MEIFTKKDVRKKVEKCLKQLYRHNHHNRMSVCLNKYLNFIKMKNQSKTNLDQFIRQNNLTKKNNRVINPESLLKKIQMANKFTINNINAGKKTKKEIEELNKAYKDILNNYL